MLLNNFTNLLNYYFAL